MADPKADLLHRLGNRIRYVEGFCDGCEEAMEDLRKTFILEGDTARLATLAALQVRLTQCKQTCQAITQAVPETESGMWSDLISRITALTHEFAQLNAEILTLNDPPPMIPT